ncbi:MAG: cytochrome BD ubiquinol oxidase subunit II [Betaproteobacteria bacterium 13_1_40CM_4_64_4]|nr:MAG: cytochrome BD ubiquinol oxidase subunit II [Betaproteobacteria bacterium 13_1_40CM_4_64_4]
MHELSQPGGWLPLVFMALMGLAMLVYVVLDGYDLGVGILLGFAANGEKDPMVESIGPFWDANETWLVLGIGLLLSAFPIAHGIILGELYLPVAIMLLGLILRGVAFDFRMKARAVQKGWWNGAFHAGSLIAALAQGVMLGRYVTGFQAGAWAWAFALFVGVSLAAGYTLLGACWLLMKTEGELQRRALAWAQGSLWLAAAGIAAISVATPLVSSFVFHKWFSFPNIVLLAPVPLMTAVLFALVGVTLRLQPRADEAWAWVPFAGSVGIFVLAFFGLAFSIFPFVIVDRMTLWQAAAAPKSLIFILVGAVIVLPVMAASAAYSYWVFRGKARALSY